MLDPLNELVASLIRSGAVPAGWRERYAPRGDLASVWASCDVPRVMQKVLFMAARDDDAARAVKAVQSALDDARAHGIAMDTARRRACDAIRVAVPDPPSLETLDARVLALRAQRFGCFAGGSAGVRARIPSSTSEISDA